MSAPKITVSVRAIDGYRTTRRFKTLAGAQRFAQERVGETPEISHGLGYAVAADGVVKVSVDGATLRDLFPVACHSLFGPDDEAAEYDRIMREEAARERAYALSDARGAALEARRYEVRPGVGCTCSVDHLQTIGCDCGAAETVAEAAKRRWPLTAVKVDGGRAYEIFTGSPADLKRHKHAVFARLALTSPEGYDILDGFTSDQDDELADWVNHLLRSRSRDRLDLAAKLAIVRECYDALGDQRARESAAELYAENAWLRAAEAPTNDDLGFAQWEASRGL